MAVATGVSANDMNGVVSRPGAPIPEELVRELLGWFAELEVPASWIVEGEDEALARRLVAAGARPEATGWWSGRAIDGAFPSARPNGEVVVTRVTVGDELESWLELASRCGWIADERDRDARRYLYLSVGLADDSLTHWLALRDGRPVGMASSFQVNDVVDLCNLAVVVAERRRGIGRALAGARILAAQRGGARMAVSALSPDGWELYRGLGFTSVLVAPDRCFYLPVPPP